MKVLFCTLDYPPSPAGGAERQAQLQAEGLQRIGHEVDVVCPQVGAIPSGRVNGVRVVRLPSLRIGPAWRVVDLLLLGAYLLLRLRRYDLVHVHLANLQADVAVAAAQLVGRPSYLKIAAGGPLGEIGRLRRASLVSRYFGIRHATRIQAISAEIAEDVRRLGVSGDRIVRIPNGVIVSHRGLSDRDRLAAKRHLGFDTAIPVVIYMGRMERDKGVHDLVSIWRRPPGDQGSNLVLLGSPGMKDPVATSGLPPGVMHRPWTSSVGRYLAAADVFILPSNAEGMSNALLEAMASGLPCIATRVGAAMEMIDDGKSGILVGAGDRAALRSAVETLVNDAGLRQRLGAAARDSVRERYGIDAVVRQIESAYRSLVVAQ